MLKSGVFRIDEAVGNVAQVLHHHTFCSYFVYNTIIACKASLKWHEVNRTVMAVTAGFFTVWAQ